MCSSEKKRIDMQLTFQNAQNLGGGAITIGPAPHHKITVRDANGVEVKDIRVLRTLSHQRPKGPKIHSQGDFPAEFVSAGGLTELSVFDSIHVIDTASKTINGELVSAACVISIRLVPRQDAYEIVCSPNARIYELHGMTRKPELLAILKLIHDIGSSPRTEKLHFAIVNDSDLGLHQSINRRLLPLYGMDFLPQEFQLLYAGDTGSELLNSVLRLCDSLGKRYLRQYENEELDVNRPFHKLREDPHIFYTMAILPGVEIANPVISAAMTFAEGATWELHGILDEQPK